MDGWIFNLGGCIGYRLQHDHLCSVLFTIAYLLTNISIQEKKEITNAYDCEQWCHFAFMQLTENSETFNTLSKQRRSFRLYRYVKTLHIQDSVSSRRLTFIYLIQSNIFNIEYIWGINTGVLFHVHFAIYLYIVCFQVWVSYRWRCR